MKKKLLTLIAVCALVVTTVLGLTACAKPENTNTQKIVRVGYTINPPLNYKEGNELVGFDTELTKAVFEKLGYKVVFTEIEWNNKYADLKAETIDCIWNGFTANSTDSDGIQRSDKVDFSYYYMNNQQAIVVNGDSIADEVVANEEALAAKFNNKKGQYEIGSAAEWMMTDIFTTSQNKGAIKQIDTLVEVNSNACDFAVIDYITAKQNVGKGNYKNLKILENTSKILPAEKYAVGFRKGDALKDQVNKTLVELEADGTVAKIAAKYGLTNKMISFADQAK